MIPAFLRPATSYRHLSSQATVVVLLGGCIDLAEAPTRNFLLVYFVVDSPDKFAGGSNSPLSGALLVTAAEKRLII
jgi:hypothetical protein